MDRGKPAMKRIENASKREVTFCKRRLGLLKQARKLSSLCDASVAIIGFSSSGILFDSAGPRSMEDIIQAYFETQAGRPFEHSAGSPLRNEMKKLKEELQVLAKEESYISMDELKHLSVTELLKLESELVLELNSVHDKQDRLMAEQRKAFMRKEQELLIENESLRKELKRARIGVALSTTCSACNDEDTVDSQEMKRLKKELKILEKEERDIRLDKLQYLSIMELKKLESELVPELDSERHMQELLMAEQRKEFLRKEQELLIENESLRKEVWRSLRKED